MTTITPRLFCDHFTALHRQHRVGVWVQHHSGYDLEGTLTDALSRVIIASAFLRGLANTKHRCGVLIFASMAEHYARIVADQGIASKVGQSEWQEAVDALTRHIRGGQIAAGFIAAIEHCGAVLLRPTRRRMERPMTCLTASLS